MNVKGVAFCVFVIVTVGFDGSDGAPRPCPQFLPVVVRMESSRTPYHLKTSLKVKDDKENLISDDSEKASPALSLSDLLLPEASKELVTSPPDNNTPLQEKNEVKTKNPKLLLISEIPKDNLEGTKKASKELFFTSPPENKPLQEKNEENTTEPKLLLISEIPKDDLEGTRKPAGPHNQRPKKRRRSRPKESRKIILSQNSNWSLRTINDKPAAEVLMTDKASVARDLKDATESALIDVKKLED